MACQNSMPIHAAAALGCTSDVISLCMNSELVNAANPLGWTPIMYGAYYGHIDVVSALLSLGADVSVRNKFGGCIYTLAAASGNIEVIRALHCYHRIPSENLSTSLAAAVLFGHLSIARFLINIDADPNSPMEHSGVMPLMLAVVENHVEMVKFLVLQGADLASQNCAGYSALQLAMIIGNKTIISYFNEKLGSNIESVEAYGTCKNKEAVVQAAISGDLFRLKSLLSRDPSLSTSQHWMINLDGENMSVFEDDDVFVALEDEKYDVKQKKSITFSHHMVPTFGSKNYEVGRSDSFGLSYSPCTSSFHCDPYNNNEHELKDHKYVLINAETNFTSKNISGSEYCLSVASPIKFEGPQKSELTMSEVNKTKEKGMVASPLILACFNGHVEVARLLIAAGADPNRQRKGRTPLMVAAITLNMELVKLLLSAGADPLVESHADSLTAFELASLSGADTELLSLLASCTIPILYDDSNGFKSYLHTRAPLKLDCWISPNRIVGKLQSLVSPKHPNNICSLERRCFSDCRKSKKWRASPLQKLRKSRKTKAKSLFSTPVSYLSSESESKVKKLHQWEHSFAKPQECISDTCFNFSLSQIPSDTPFKTLASDKISTVKPFAFVQCSEINIIEKVRCDKNKLNVDNPVPYNQHEGTTNSKNLTSFPPELPLHDTSEVPLLSSQVNHHIPRQESDSERNINTLIPLETKLNATYTGENFEGYIEEYDLKEYISLFRNNKVADIEIVLSITEDDLKEMGVMCPEERYNILNKIHGNR